STRIAFALQVSGVSLMASTHRPPLRASGHEHDLPPRPGREDRLVGRRRLGERELPSDDRPERLVLEPRHDRRLDPRLLVEREVVERHAEHVRVARHGRARVDLRLAAAPDDDDAAVERERLEVGARFSFASISTMTSMPRPAVSFTASARCSLFRWSSTWCAPALRAI